MSELFERPGGQDNGNERNSFEPVAPIPPLFGSLPPGITPPATEPPDSEGFSTAPPAPPSPTGPTVPMISAVPGTGDVMWSAPQNVAPDLMFGDAQKPGPASVKPSKVLIVALHSVLPAHLFQNGRLPGKTVVDSV